MVLCLCMYDTQSLLAMRDRDLGFCFIYALTNVGGQAKRKREKEEGEGTEKGQGRYRSYEIYRQGGKRRMRSGTKIVR